MAPTDIRAAPTSKNRDIPSAAKREKRLYPEVNLGVLFFPDTFSNTTATPMAMASIESWKASARMAVELVRSLPITSMIEKNRLRQKAIDSPFLREWLCA